MYNLVVILEFVNEIIFFEKKINFRYLFKKKMNIKALKESLA